MKTALVLFCSFAAAAFAADPKPASVRNPTESSGQVKKLGSVTWDVEHHKLVWKVEKGSMVDGEFVASSEEQYEVSPDDAIMAKAEEQRGFSGDEAVALHRLLDTLSLYCAESVVWWDKGEGEPLQPRATPTAKPDKSEDPKPVKVKNTEPKEAPVYHVPDSHLVARVTKVR
jgi:hypothetical protein